MRSQLVAGAAAIGLVLLGTATLIRERGRAVSDTPRPTRLTPQAEAEILQVEARINQIESDSLERARGSSLDALGELTLLGKLILFDQNLSVNRNESCAFCHMPDTGFTGPSSVLNMTTVAYPGSVRTRFGNRKPPTHTYVTFTPVLHYNALQGDLVGGEFWDMRATGIRLNNPTAE